VFLLSSVSSLLQSTWLSVFYALCSITCALCLISIVLRMCAFSILYSQTRLSGKHWDLIMSIHLGRVTTIHVLYFTLCLNGTRQMISIKADYSLKRYPLREVWLCCITIFVVCWGFGTLYFHCRWRNWGKRCSVLVVVNWFCSLTNCSCFTMTLLITWMIHGSHGSCKVLKVL